MEKIKNIFKKMADGIKNLWGKIISLDKKILIPTVAAIVLVIAAVIGLVIFMVTRPEENKPDDKETVVTTEKKEEDTTEEETTEAETTEAETTEAETTEAETTEAETTAPPQTDAQTEAVTNPAGSEILGQGSTDQPYLEIPAVGNGSMSVTTVAVPAGSSLYYAIYRVGGMVLTINDANAYVVCNGQTYYAQGGVLSFIVPSALASDAITFQIGNSGGAATSFTLVFTNLTGSQANPTVISSVTGEKTQSLEKGDSDGYTYKYYAEQTGTIRFYVRGTTDSILSVTNNRNSAQRTTDSDAQFDANGNPITDSQGNVYIDIEVNAGDELIILIGAKPDRRGNYPADTIVWSGQYI